MEGYTEEVGVRHRHAVGVADIHLDENASSNERTHGEASMREVSVYFTAPWNAFFRRALHRFWVRSKGSQSARLGSARLYSKSFRTQQTRRCVRPRSLPGLSEILSLTVMSCM